MSRFFASTRRAPGRPTFRRPAGRPIGRLGLSLVEVMVSVGIAAMLLTAAAAAFDASSSTVQTNDEFFRATQAARVSMHQILTQVRRGSVNLAWNANTLRLVTAPDAGNAVGQDISYTYVAGTKKLTLVTNDDATDPDYTLASNVSAMSFDVEAGTDYNNAPCVANVVVSIKVRVGKNEVMLSGSAAPRKNLRY